MPPSEASWNCISSGGINCAKMTELEKYKCIYLFNAFNSLLSKNQRRQLYFLQGKIKQEKGFISTLHALLFFLMSVEL